MLKKTIITVSAFAIMLTACGGNDGGDKAAPTDGKDKELKPVTLRMLQDGATVTDEEFEKMIAAPVRAKYPHIAVEMIKNTKGDNGLSDLIGSGSFPDFTLTTYPRIRVHRNLQVAYDLTDYIASSKMNIGKFDPASIEISKVYGGGKLYALPFSLNFVATFYNKELFDKFGVEYPKQGMTWEDAIRLANRFSRTAEGVQYKGLMLPGIGDLRTQLSLPYVDANTNKALINSDGMKRMFELIKTVNGIPGNKGATLDDFIKTQTLAMVASYDARIAALENLQGTPSEFNWDITQYPSFPDRPNTSVISSGHFLIVSALSNQKEEAFQVVSLLTSEENQLLITEHGRFTSLNNDSIKNKYGVNSKSLQGKNVKAVFLSKFAFPHVPTEFDSLASPHLNTAVKEVIDGVLDINSSLRKAEDATNRDIEAAKK